eukprot:gene25427-30702_t
MIMPSAPQSTLNISKQENIEAVISRRLHGKNESNQMSHQDMFSLLLVFLLLLITFITYPADWSHKVTIQHVWYYGWLTAISTGLGVVPFFFIKEPDKYYMGVCNAIAGGMMLAASYSLLMEGATFEEINFGILSLLPNLPPSLHSIIRTVIGGLMGVLFILCVKQLLERFEEEDEQEPKEKREAAKESDWSWLTGGVDLKSASAQRMVLIILVMTLHSLSEGVGIGVSFGGRKGMKLGQFISLSLAVHNVPEGLAVGLVMVGQKGSQGGWGCTLRTLLWAIFTSLPQPIFSVPAFIFIERFVPLLPGGLGFAAGAMSYVGIFELLSEAVQETSLTVTALVGCLSCAVMMVLQDMVKQAM